MLNIIFVLIQVFWNFTVHTNLVICYAFNNHRQLHYPKNGLPSSSPIQSHLDLQLNA